MLRMPKVLLQHTILIACNVVIHYELFSLFCVSKKYTVFLEEAFGS